MVAMRRRGRVAAIVFVTAAAAAGCTGGAGDKGGGEPIHLKMAEGGASSSTDPAGAYFVARVDELSAGALKIDVSPNWGNDQPDNEQRTVQDVRSGRFDLGSVGTRVFDTLGVDSFQALDAPMLIDSYQFENAVITSDLPGQMLKGLSGLDLTGLAVLAGGLRKPVADRPLLSPSDWRGITFASLRSRVHADAIRALGATPTDVVGSALTDAFRTGEVQGTDQNLLILQQNGRTSQAPYVTANVNLWPKTVALMAHPASLAKLSPEQREWLRRAAADAAARSTGLFQQEAAMVRDSCTGGARLANASPADLAALRKAFVPVYATLEQDPQTKAFIGRIEALKLSTPPGPPLAIPKSCTGPADRPPDQRGDPSVLNGVYRIEWSYEDLLAAGTTQTFASQNFGIITLTLNDGDSLIHWAQPPDDCRGSYVVLRTSVWFDNNGGDCGGTVAASWSLSNGELHLSTVHTDPDGVIFWSKPWKVIG